MVAGWDGMLPKWFTRLDPRWKTPTRSIGLIVLISIGMCLVATAGTGAQEAFQLIVTAGNICYGIYYLMLFAIPLVVGSKFGRTPGWWLKLAAVSGLVVTLLSIGFNLLPIVDVKNVWVFGVKVLCAALGLNVVGMGIYWNAKRKGVVTVEG
jgi:amino acid transporter